MAIQLSLKAARVNVGLTQKEAAQRLGIHAQTLASLERDSSEIPHSLIQKMSKLYKVPSDVLFFGLYNEFIK